MRTLERSAVEANLDDFTELLSLQMNTIGLEPDHPIVRTVEETQYPVGSEARLWFTMLYFAYMALPSALLASRVLREPFDVKCQSLDDPTLRLPTGFERRGLRTPVAMAKHLSAIAEGFVMYRSGRAWLTGDFFTGEPEANWKKLTATLTGVYGNGRWAAYNTGEGLMAINAFNVLPGDMGMDGSTGPKSGLALLYPTESADCRTTGDWEALGKQLQRDVRARGVSARLDQLETNLCDYHSMLHGEHYVGHYPDLLQAQIARVTERYANEGKWIAATLGTLADVRKSALPDWTLGEVHGWFGERKPLLTYYRETGRIRYWDDAALSYPGPEGV